MKIRSKILVPMITVSVLLFSAAGAIAVATISKTSLVSAEQKIISVAEQYAYQIEKELEGPFATVRTVAAIFEGYKYLDEQDRRSTYLTVLQSLAEGHPEFLSVWTVWPPQSIDGMDPSYRGTRYGNEEGSFSVSYYRKDGELEFRALPGAVREEKYYTTPMYAVSESIVGPFSRAAGGDGPQETVLSVVAPIVRAGKAVAVVGVDISVSRFMALTQAVKPLSGSRAALLNNELMYIHHYDAAMTGQTLVTSNVDEYRSIQGGLQYILPGEAKNLRIYTPIRMSRSTRAWSLFIDTPRSEIRSSSGANRLVVTLLIAFAAVVLAQSVVTVFVASVVAGPATKANALLRDIAEGEGDLTMRLGVRASDEIGELASSFDRFTEKLADMIRRIKNTMAELKAGATELDDSMESASAAVRKIDLAIDGVVQRAVNQAASVEEVSSTVEEITRNIESLDRMIERQRDGVAESSASIEQMVGNIGSIAKSIESFSEYMDGLVSSSDAGKGKLTGVGTLVRDISEQSQGLLEANKVIQAIAAQTNLLAMNAAIEAAHAGEAGAGFAVVADEIRKLAEVSAARSKEIARSIGSIRGGIDRVVLSSGDAEKAFEEILVQVKRVSEIEGEVTRAIDEQTTGSRQVLESLSMMKNITEEVRGASSEMTVGASAAGAEMRNLLVITDELKRAMEEIGRESDGIKTATERVATLGERNAGLIGQVEAGTDRFKV